MLNFISKRTDGVLKVPSGFDTVVIPLNFVPEIIKVGFKDSRKVAPTLATQDTVDWSLIISAASAYLVISYDTYAPREVRYVATIPKVDPELTINF